MTEERKLKFFGFYKAMDDEGLDQTQKLIENSDYWFLTMLKVHPKEPDKTMVMFQFPERCTMKDPKRLKKALNDAIEKIKEVRDKIKE